jgi:hypothetical protein
MRVWLLLGALAACGGSDETEPRVVVPASLVPVQEDAGTPPVSGGSARQKVPTDNKPTLPTSQQP